MYINGAHYDLTEADAKEIRSTYIWLRRKLDYLPHKAAQSALEIATFYVKYPRG